jgi:hypothetical protein
MATESFGFQAEISQLLDLIISMFYRLRAFTVLIHLFQTLSTPTKRFSFVKSSLTVPMPSTKSVMLP